MLTFITKERIFTPGTKVRQQWFETLAIEGVAVCQWSVLLFCCFDVMGFFSGSDPRGDISMCLAGCWCPPSLPSF